ncbi:MAG: hypothetical protein A3F10_00315 [Coxiella sp. RIFCSPHIGHO2_12_FULL_42_15]|nr:MAG: hypothetical protein A3F10_00315 [Coxiella sp. RIFCSPHIGHO2_12_FULL_42_15]
MSFSGINYWAVLAATVLGYLLGAFWYSRKMFLKAWNNALGDQAPIKHSILAYIFAFIFQLISAYGLAVLLGQSPALLTALWIGFWVGLFFVTTALGINYVFSNRSLRLLFIDGGYHIVKFVLYGFIIAIWRK